MFKFLKGLISSTAKESSKRAIALYTMLLVTAVVIAGIFNKVDLIIMLSILLSFVGTLMGISSYQSFKEKSIGKDKVNISEED